MVRSKCFKDTLNFKVQNTDFYVVKISVKNLNSEIQPFLCFGRLIIRTFNHHVLRLVIMPPIMQRDHWVLLSCYLCIVLRTRVRVPSVHVMFVKLCILSLDLVVNKFTNEVSLVNKRLKGLFVFLLFDVAEDYGGSGVGLLAGVRVGIGLGAGGGSSQSSEKSIVGDEIVGGTVRCGNDGGGIFEAKGDDEKRLLPQSFTARGRKLSNSWSLHIQFQGVKLSLPRELMTTISETFDTMWKPRQIGSKTLTFEMIEEKKILKIEDMSGNEVYLGWESVSEVWSLESVLRYRLSYSSGSNFKYFYEDVIRAVAEMSGDVK
ncbi:hypothetical protein FQA39_LY15200 [Lamprigera yunnana]|nr:hypothetical protein FQA39_LY15200 [Lamprigera yunnana]